MCQITHLGVFQFEINYKMAKTKKSQLLLILLAFAVSASISGVLYFTSPEVGLEISGFGELKNSIPGLDLFNLPKLFSRLLPN